MAGGNDFAARVEAERLRLRKIADEKRISEAARQKAAQEARTQIARRQAAENAARAAEEERKRKLEHAERQRLLEARANPKSGTKPTVFWGAEAGRTCQEFLAIMKNRSYSGATTLHNVAFRREWKIRGYGVGCVIFGYRYERLAPRAEREQKVIDRATPLDYNVFLCEDNLLRLYINKRGSKWDDFTSPNIISNIEGKPEIGKFFREKVTVCTTEKKYKYVQSGNMKMGLSTTKKAYQAHVDVEAYIACFHQLPIDDVLFPYVLGSE